MGIRNNREGLFPGIHRKPSPIFRCQNNTTTLQPCCKNSSSARNTGTADKTCSRNSTSFPAENGVLPHIFSSDQKGWQLPSNNQPTASKQVPCTQNFQNGKYKVSAKISQTRRLGYHHRPQRCLFSCTNHTVPQKIPTVCNKRSMFPVQSSSLWTDNSSKGIHQSDSSSYGIPTQTGHKHHSIFGRLAPTRFRHKQSNRKERFCTECISPSGSYNQLHKVKSCTFPRFCIHRHQISTESGNSYSSPTQNNQIAGRNIPLPDNKICDCQEISKPTRSDGSYNRYCSICKTAYATNTDVSFHVLETIKPKSNPRVQNSHTKYSQRAFDLVVPPRKSTERQPSKHSACISDSRNRCLPHRMGRSHTRTCCPRNMESVRKKLTHKQFRTFSGLQLPETFCPYLQIKTCSCQNRQCNSGLLHKQRRRHTFTTNVHAHLADSKLDTNKSDSAFSSTCCRSSQHIGRPAESSQNPPNRMDPEYLNNFCSFSDFRKTNDRPVCIRQKPSASAILHLASERKSSGNRCVFNRLDGTDSICISPNMSNSQSSITDGASTLQAASHCSNVAQEDLVPRSPTPIDQLSFDPSRERGPSQTTQGPVLPPSSRDSQAISVAPQQLARGTPRLSGRARSLVEAAIRQGTRKDYKCKYGIFCDWCNKQGFNPSFVSVEQAVNFLASLEEKGLGYRTVCGYRSMLTHYLGSVDGIPFSQHKLVKDFMRGFFNTKPPTRKLPPQWNLATVLQALKYHPFEPLKDISLKELTLKTCFLLAISSARRADDLSKLSIRDDLFKLSKTSVTFLPDGLLKQDRPSHLSPPVSIHAYLVDRKLCPVRAVREYISRTKDIRGTTTAFFITFGKPHHAASTQTISRWIVSIIASTCDCSEVTGHSTRSMASSWASLKGVPLTDILSTADWSNAQTFCKHYKFTETFSQAVLGVQ